MPDLKSGLVEYDEVSPSTQMPLVCASWPFDRIAYQSHQSPKASWLRPGSVRSPMKATPKHARMCSLLANCALA